MAETISGPVSTTVTLGVNYSSPLSITSAGSVDPETYGAVGIERLPAMAEFFKRSDPCRRLN